MTPLLDARWNRFPVNRDSEFHVLKSFIGAC
jgi:hypothetical protein